MKDNEKDVQFLQEKSFPYDPPAHETLHRLYGSSHKGTEHHIAS